MSGDSFGKIKSIVLSKLKDLSTDLTYHNLNHTIDVLEQSVKIALEEGITDEKQQQLLKIAALYHDTGFLETYVGHEKRSCAIFLSDAADFELNDTEKEMIVNLIMATQIPQEPHTLLEKIICDADLDYLGRNDFFEIGDNLRKEFLRYNVVSNDAEWKKVQIKFLQNHKYHTSSSQRKREPGKQLNFNKLV